MSWAKNLTLEFSILVWLVVLTMITDCPTSAAPKITKEKAIDIARNFAQKVGALYSVQPQVQFPVKGRRDLYRVDFAGKLEVYIAPDTGEVVGCGHGAAKIEATRTPSAEKSLSREEAIKAATHYLTAAVLSPDAKLKSARLQTHTSLRTPYSEWEIRWVRVYKGYEYKEDFCRVTVDAITGELLSLVKVFLSQAPTNVKISVKKVDAVKKAQTYLKGKDIAFGKLRSAKLLIVCPNDYWEKQKRGLDELPHPPTRLVWVVGFTKGEDAVGQEHFRQVWVDATNGEVVGGMQCL